MPHHIIGLLLGESLPASVALLAYLLRRKES